jgi:RNA polymerase sigma factor (sigma-70 family)
LTPHPDNSIIESLIRQDGAVIEDIYRRLSGKVRYYVTQNGGDADDAADVFQESLIDLFHQAKSGKIILSCPFDAFFLLVCKRKWLNVLKSAARSSRVTIATDDLSYVGEDTFRQAEQVAEQARKEQLYRQQLALLSERCREVIQATLTGTHQEQVAQSLGVSYAYLRKKKSECVDQLIRQIRAAQ